MERGPVEVQTDDGAYLVSQNGDIPRCQHKTAEGIKDITYWNDIPAGSRPTVQQAVDSLARSPVYFPAANSNFRWD
jgi:hypothetical protein